MERENRCIVCQRLNKVEGAQLGRQGENLAPCYETYIHPDQIITDGGLQARNVFSYVGCPQGIHDKSLVEQGQTPSTEYDEFLAANPVYDFSGAQLFSYLIDTINDIIEKRKGKS